MIPIIIVNWNGYEDTVECVDSVFLSLDTDYHLHIIDNNSNNNEGPRLSKLYLADERVTVHLFEENYGFTGAHIRIWQDVLRHEDYRYLFLLNNDTTVDQKWLGNLMSFVEQKKCHIVSTKMIQYFDPELMDNAGHMMLNTGEILPIGHGESIDLYNESFKNLGACGGAVLYSTEMIHKIGFFDPHFSTGYEDAELGVRAAVAGYECWYCPEAIIYHKGGQSIKKIFNEDYSVSIFSHILYSYFKNLKWSDILINTPFLLSRFVIIMFIDVLCRRWSYLRVLYRAIGQTYALRKKIRSKRAAITYRRGSILGQMKFFLWTDIKRFSRIYIDKKDSAMDSYGKSELIA